MSAFVVSNTTIDRCVYALLPQGFSCETGDEFGRQLVAMNNRAVRWRYDDADKRGMTTATDDYQYRVSFPPVMERLKALQCLLYQCTEGDVPKSALYERVKTKIHELQSEVISELPEYREIPWDFPELSRV